MFLGVVAGFVLAKAAAMNLQPILGFPVGAALVLGPPLGWALFVAFQLAKSYPNVVQVRRQLLMGAFVLAFLFGLLGLHMMKLLTEGSEELRTTTFLVCLAAVAAQIYVFWTASRALVEAEEGKSVRFETIVGTLLLFFMFIFGLFFIQRRLRRLFPDQGTEARGA